jgi:hypothetical protein
MAVSIPIPGERTLIRQCGGVTHGTTQSGSLLIVGEQKGADETAAPCHHAYVERAGAREVRDAATERLNKANAEAAPLR